MYSVFAIKPTLEPAEVAVKQTTSQIRIVRRIGFLTGLLQQNFDRFRPVDVCFEDLTCFLPGGWV
jgi:hypothetical protein